MRYESSPVYPGFSVVTILTELSSYRSEVGNYFYSKAGLGYFELTSGRDLRVRNSIVRKLSNSYKTSRRPNTFNRYSEQH